MQAKTINNKNSLMEIGSVSSEISRESKVWEWYKIFRIRIKRGRYDSLVCNYRFKYFAFKMTLNFHGMA